MNLHYVSMAIQLVLAFSQPENRPFNYAAWEKECSVANVNGRIVWTLR